jgi:hypothetical protein
MRRHHLGKVLDQSLGGARRHGRDAKSDRHGFSLLSSEPRPYTPGASADKGRFSDVP